MDAAFAVLMVDAVGFVAICVGCWDQCDIESSPWVKLSFLIKKNTQHW